MIREISVQLRFAATAAVLLLAAANIVTAEQDIKLAQGGLSAFMGREHFALEQIFGEDSGGWDIFTTQKGTVLAHSGSRIRRSVDGGRTWSEPIDLGKGSAGTNAIVDEVTGAVLLVNPDGCRFISCDDGLTWKREEITVLPNLLGHGSSEKNNLSVGAMESGVTLTFGKHKGRLLMPARWSPSNELPWRPYIYNTAIYSDDRGKTWQTSAPFPVIGTGEAALAEISDGRVLYSCREHMSRGNRFFAWSYDGGDRWLNFW